MPATVCLWVRHRGSGVEVVTSVRLRLTTADLTLLGLDVVCACTRTLIVRVTSDLPPRATSFFAPLETAHPQVKSDQVTLVVFTVERYSVSEERTRIQIRVGDARAGRISRVTRNAYNQLFGHAATLSLDGIIESHLFPKYAVKPRG